MAKYTIKHSCGHSAEHQLFGKMVDRQHTLAYRAKDVCPDCRKSEHDAAINAASLSFPELSGSPKQIAWARGIRIATMQKIDDLIATGRPDAPEAVKAKMAAARALISGKTSANYWIDTRDESPMQILIAASKQLYSGEAR